MLLGDSFISLTALILLEATRSWQRKAILLQNCVCSLQKVLSKLRNKIEREASHRKRHIAAACKCPDTILPLGCVPEETFLRKNTLPLQFPFTLILEPLMGLWELSGRWCAAGQIFQDCQCTGPQKGTCRCREHCDLHLLQILPEFRHHKFFIYVYIYLQAHPGGLAGYGGLIQRVDNRRFPIDFQRL